MSLVMLALLAVLQDAKPLPDGSEKAVQDIDLPTTVGNGKAKVAPKGDVKMTKLETRGIVKFVALPEPEVRFIARVSGGDGGDVSVTVSPDGGVCETHKAKKARAPVVDKNAPTKDHAVPEPAAKAVKAMRDVFPDMVFDLVEEVPYVDGTTETIVMLWYEVEFFINGVKNEFNATPDGVVIRYHKPVSVDDLPKAAADAIAKAVPGGKIEDVLKSETRAGPKFAALETPVIVYEIQPRAEGDAPAASVKLRMDGTEVKEPEWPEWIKKANKKDGK